MAMWLLPYQFLTFFYYFCLELFMHQLICFFGNKELCECCSIEFWGFAVFFARWVSCIFFCNIDFSEYCGTDICYFYVITSYAVVIIHLVNGLFIYFCFMRPNTLHKTAGFFHFKLKGWSSWKYCRMIKRQ